MAKGPYTKSNRLADVLALIQVLALDKSAHRSEKGMTEELQGAPRSGAGLTWYAVAGEHPEFFRVDPHSEHGLSLAARHVLPHEHGQDIPQLAPEFTSALLQTAITLHDRQVNKAEWWKSLIPLWAALLGGIFGTLSTLLTLWLKGSCSH